MVCSVRCSSPLLVVTPNAAAACARRRLGTPFVVSVVCILPFFLLQLCANDVHVAAAATAHKDSGNSDVPFEVTPPAVVEAMLTLATVGPKSVVVDLGCGDGRIVHAAARRGVLQAVGIDVNAELIDRSTRGAEPQDIETGRVAFHQADLFASPSSSASTNVFHDAVRNATVVTLYWVPSVIERLAPVLFRLARPGTVIISHDYPFEGLQPTVEWFSDGFGEKKKINGVDVVYLYKYVVGRGAKTFLKPCENGVCTFQISHQFLHHHQAGSPSSPLRTYTAAYTQRFVPKALVGVEWLVHVMVADDKVRAMWVPGLRVNQTTSSSDEALRDAPHGPVKIAYRMRRWVSGDAPRGMEGSGALLLRGFNTKRNSKTTNIATSTPSTARKEILVDNLGLGDVALPLNFTLAIDVLNVVGARKKLEDDGKEEL